MSAAEKAHAAAQQKTLNVLAQFRLHITQLGNNETVHEAVDKIRQCAVNAEKQRLDAAQAARSVGNHSEMPDIGKDVSEKLNACSRAALDREHEQRLALVRAAHRAAAETKKAAKHVEKAQRYAGTHERVYEGDYLHSELSAEHLGDEVEELGRAAQTAAASFDARIKHDIKVLQAHVSAGQARDLGDVLQRLQNAKTTLRESAQQKAREAAQQKFAAEKQRTEDEERQKAEAVAKLNAERETQHKAHEAAEQRATEAAKFKAEEEVKQKAKAITSQDAAEAAIAQDQAMERSDDAATDDATAPSLSPTTATTTTTSSSGWFLIAFARVGSPTAGLLPAQVPFGLVVGAFLASLGVFSLMRRERRAHAVVFPPLLG